MNAKEVIRDSGKYVFESAFEKAVRETEKQKPRYRICWGDGRYTHYLVPLRWDSVLSCWSVDLEKPWYWSVDGYSLSL